MLCYSNLKLNKHENYTDKPLNIYAIANRQIINAIWLLIIDRLISNQLIVAVKHQSLVRKSYMINLMLLRCLCGFDLFTSRSSKTKKLKLSSSCLIN